MKNFFKRLFVTGIVAVSTYGLFQGFSNKNAADLSSLTLANVEALAQDEGCGGLAKLSDPIWHISVKIGGSLTDAIFPEVTCITGGCYVCARTKS